ncbi:hypothetical protein BJ508DRAFT_412241 [Ascobolus immersus RN42]|uniref:Uncharacterized protein n=1 Tax=Ascobolus immersus RN42 TaxID=1160509 RepID=A0A3N4IG17_ASCIM|nr:hypothetical protein BJ508DRAFT_412241 [Ascobolus immersus RN42]
MGLVVDDGFAGGRFSYLYQSYGPGPKCKAVFDAKAFMETVSVEEHMAMVAVLWMQDVLQEASKKEEKAEPWYKKGTVQFSYRSKKRTKLRTRLANGKFHRLVESMLWDRLTMQVNEQVPVSRFQEKYEFSAFYGDDLKQTEEDLAMRGNAV